MAILTAIGTALSWKDGRGMAGRLAGLVLAACLGLAAQENAVPEQAEPEYTSPEYQAKLYDQWLKDAGLEKITLDGRTFVARSIVHCTITADGKAVAANEKTAPDHVWKDDTLTTVKRLTDAAGIELAEVTRTARFTPDAVDVEISIRALRDFTFRESWLGYGEILFLPVDQLVGSTVEAYRVGAKTTALVPKVYSKETWSLDSRESERIRIVLDGHAATFASAGDARMAFNHYGGSSIELTIRTPLKSWEMGIKQGDVRKLGYQIRFEKL